MTQPAAFRETAGIATAIFIVLAYIGIGFVQVGVFLATGQTVAFPSDWNAAMLSMSSAALGYLIGKEINRPNAPVATSTTVTPYEGDAFRVDTTTGTTTNDKPVSPSSGTSNV